MPIDRSRMTHTMIRCNEILETSMEFLRSTWSHKEEESKLATAGKIIRGPIRLVSFSASKVHNYCPLPRFKILSQQQP